MRTGSLVAVQIGAGTEIKLIGGNSDRKSITFAHDNAGAVFLRNDSLGAVAGGFAVTRGSSPTVLTLAEHGDIVQKEWWGFCTGVANVGIIEAFE